MTVGSAREGAGGGLASPGTRGTLRDQVVLHVCISMSSILQIEMLSYSEERAAPVQCLALLLIIIKNYLSGISVFPLHFSSDSTISSVRP